MSTFARIKRVAAFKKVVYYSVVLTESDDEDVLKNNTESLFEDFQKRMGSSQGKKLTHILAWLKEIGNNRGAQIEDFRPENRANALPPKGKDRKPVYIEKGKKSPNDLRLYCFYANKYVVFLFNGDIKTTKKAQDCPQVGPHYKMADRLASCINDLFIKKEIFWINNDQNIDFDDDLIFEL